MAGDILSRRIVRSIQSGGFINSPSTYAFVEGGRIAFSEWIWYRVAQWWAPLKYRLFFLLHSMHLERWMSWPRLDTIILCSYVGQNLYRWPHLFSDGLYDKQVGVSWLHVLGLIRVSAILRVFFMARCAENARILQHATTAEWRRMIYVGHLIVTILYVTATPNISPRESVQLDPLSN